MDMFVGNKCLLWKPYNDLCTAKRLEVTGQIYSSRSLDRASRLGSGGAQDRVCGKAAQYRYQRRYEKKSSVTGRSCVEQTGLRML
jgi:hypothetical protein